MARAKLMRGEAEVGACEITQFARGIGEDRSGSASLRGRYGDLTGGGAGRRGAARRMRHASTSKPVFWRSDAAADGSVPWTPVEVGEGVRVWGRECRHAGRALPEQIVNQGPRYSRVRSG